MSFKFNWDSFTNDDDFYDRARTLLSDALNRGKQPNILADAIRVRELYLGDESPQLEILEVGDLGDDKFRGIFKLTYNGNASITLTTKVRANPLQVYSMSTPAFCMPQFQGSSTASLSIPLNLTLSDIKLSGIIILVFSKAKGLTLVFRNDPLQSIRVTSTFDTLPGIARFLQTQIETQIRVLFREDLPAILHKLSLKWTPQSNIGLEKSRLHQKLSEHQQQQQQQQQAAAAAAVSSESHRDTGSDCSFKQDFDIPTPQSAHSSVSMALSDTTDLTDPEVEEYTMFGDINPDMPILSQSNMVKLHALCASNLTLSLFTPSISETVYRANLEAYTKQERTNIQNVDGAIDLEEIMRIQSRNYFRNSHAKPKRRVIKVGGGNKNTAEAAKKPKAAAPLPLAAAVVEEKQGMLFATRAAPASPANLPTPPAHRRINSTRLRQPDLRLQAIKGSDTMFEAAVSAPVDVHNNNNNNDNTTPIAPSRPVSPSIRRRTAASTSPSVSLSKPAAAAPMSEKAMLYTQIHNNMLQQAQAQAQAQEQAQTLRQKQQKSAKYVAQPAAQQPLLHALGQPARLPRVRASHTKPTGGATAATAAVFVSDDEPSSGDEDRFYAHPPPAYVA